MLSTQHLKADNNDDLQRAIALLQSGKLVAIPTETVYGLAANASDPEAVKGIYAAKNRPGTHPLIVHIGNIDQLQQWTVNIPEVAMKLAQRCWPGPLTLTLAKHPGVNSVVTGGLETIAIRIPNQPILLELLNQTGLGLAAPSANPYGKLSPTSAEQVQSSMDGKIDAVLDGGDCEYGMESTIVDILSEPIRILRNGPITAKQIEQITGFNTVTPETHQEAVPGNVQAHYQPGTTLKLMDQQTLLQHIPSIRTDIGCIVYSNVFTEQTGKTIRHLSPNKQQYARMLYKTLFELDQLSLEAIWLETPPNNEEWQDVNDRLQRATNAKQL